MNRPPQPPFAITVLVDPGKHTITVCDSAGNERPLKSVMICGGGFEDRAFYLFGWGGASDLGWALAESFRWSKLQTNYEEASFYRRAWVHALQWICTFLGISTLREITPAGLEEKWNQEDLDRAIREANEAKSFH